MAKIYIKEFGDAIITHIQNGVAGMAITGLSTGDVAWSRAILNEPAYILDPVADLPLIKLRFNNLKTEPGPNARMICEYEYSLFYYKRQTKGGLHQELLLADVDKIFELFSNDPSLWRLPLLYQVDPGPPGGQQMQFIYPAKLVFFPELKHTIDLPDIRISCAEITLLISSHSYPI